MLSHIFRQSKAIRPSVKVLPDDARSSEREFVVRFGAGRPRAHADLATTGTYAAAETQCQRPYQDRQGID
jgi:hypothetical protein